MDEIKSAVHHWWPRSVSKHWVGDDGYVGAVRANGYHFRTQHGKLGGIKNAHTLKMAPEGQTSPWDHSFEMKYDGADQSFPRIIEEIQNLVSIWMESNPPLTIFQEVQASNWLRLNLARSLVSICLRGPLNRFMALDLAMKLRGGRISPREQNRIIGHNIQHMLKDYVKYMSGRGKVGLLFSPEREFIFGDGFFHNLTTAGNINHSARMIIPLTPRISVIYAMPHSWTPEPMFHACMITADVTDQMNRTIEVYSKDELFYCNERPNPSKDFLLGKFQKYDWGRNPADHIIAKLPGIHEI